MGIVIRLARAITNGVLALLIRHIPDVKPIVFDQDTTEQWARKIDAAERINP